MKPTTQGVNTVELASDIKEDALRLINAHLHEGGELPAKINLAFYVGNIGDKSILAFDTIKVSGVEYKIGTLKS